MWAIIWILTLFSFRQSISGYIEIVNVTGCESCKLHLTCRHLSSIIAILSADFLQQETTFANNSLINNFTQFPTIHPRQALNRRCSGVNHCSFILTEDCPGGDTLGIGNLTVKYACISEDRRTKFCNSEITLPSNQKFGISEGFIHNPGYPRFYSSSRQCRWKLRAPYQQRIRLTIFDLVVNADKRIHDNECTDHLEIIDDGQIVKSICHLNEPPLEFLSTTDNVEVILVSRHSLVPLRGVLLHYTAVGCPTPKAPEDGYLVYRNDTAAEFRCCVGFVFPDDGARTRNMKCEGAYWDVPLPLPNCQRKITNHFKNSPGTTVELLSNMNNGDDILAPALLIVALFLINFLVLFYIYKIKQKHAIEFADEELGTLRTSDGVAS